MRRQGKYTRRVTPAQQVKRQVTHRFRWWRNMSWKKRLLVVGVPVLAFLTILPLATYFYFSRDIADQDRLMNRNNTGIVLYASDGSTEIYSSGRAERHELLPLAQISEPMKQAVIASEDKDFYSHGGFSIFSTLRAVYGYVANGGGSFGGSTITQQLAKITVLSSDRSFLRQYQAFSIAVAIENTYTKDQILEMYLNSVYFGENAFGIQDAAKTYFGTTPDKLTLAQASMLVGLLPAPSIYSPVSGNPTFAKERQSTVLSRMVAVGNVTDAEKQQAVAEQLAYQPAQSPINDSIAPHFAEMVLDELYKKYGEETVTRSGYQVTTTIDTGVQNAIQSAVSANMPTIMNNGGSNAAAVAIDPKTGEIQGLVGSADYKNTTFGKVNIATSLRQPGSSFKPIYYARALADGLITPATVLKDQRTVFGGGYVPQNADRRFRGDVTVRNALDWSLNIPAVQVMQKLGTDTTVEQAQSMGLTSIDPTKNDYGLSLALGSAEVTPMALTNAYAAFSNGGVQFTPTSIRTISSKYGDIVFTPEQTSKQVLSPQGSYLISNILADNNARTAVFGNSLNVYDAGTRAVKNVAVKTGTTNDSRDAWTVGYTPQIALGVWVGNNDNTPMKNGGSIMAGPIFTRAMGTIAAGKDTAFSEVSGVVKRNICNGNKGLANEAVKGQTYTEWFLATALPSQRCAAATPSPSPTPSTVPTTAPVDSAVTMTMTASPAGGSSFGTSVTFTATLSSTTAVGSVTFRDGAQTFGTAQVVGGSASVSTSLLAIGQHTITATFVPTGENPAQDVTATLQYQVAAAQTPNNPRNNRNPLGQ